MEQGKLRAFFERYIHVSFSRLTEQHQVLESHTLRAQDLARGLQNLLDATSNQLNHIEAKVDAISRARRHQLPERLLRLAEVQEMTGLNRNLIYSTENFPKPVKISARSTAWVLSEVQEWIQDQIEQQRTGERND